MRIVFFTSYSVSHIIPIKGLIRYLKDNNFDIVCFVHSKNVAYCIEKDVYKRQDLHIVTIDNEEYVLEFLNKSNLKILIRIPRCQ